MGRASHPPQGDPLTRRFGARPPAAADEVGELARRASDGDRRALEPLVRATYPEAYGLALRLVGDEHDARDTVQEAYARALRSIRRFRGDAAFTTWLHRITANCAADLLARRSRAAHQQLDVLDADRLPVLVDARAEHDPEGCSCQRADRERLVTALAALPERLRLVVVLRDVYDLSHDAIAAELGITVAAAKVRLHRGRRRLRDELYGPVPTDGAAGAPPARPGGEGRAVPGGTLEGVVALGNGAVVALAEADGAAPGEADHRRAARAG